MRGAALSVNGRYRLGVNLVPWYSWRLFTEYPASFSARIAALLACAPRRVVIMAIRAATAALRITTSIFAAVVVRWAY